MSVFNSPIDRYSTSVEDTEFAHTPENFTQTTEPHTCILLLLFTGRIRFFRSFLLRWETSTKGITNSSLSAVALLWVLLWRNVAVSANCEQLVSVPITTVVIRSCSRSCMGQVWGPVWEAMATGSPSSLSEAFNQCNLLLLSGLCHIKICMAKNIAST